MFFKEKTVTTLNCEMSFKKQIAVYSILFLITAIGVYFWFIVCDRTMLINRVANNDGFAQQYMVYAKIKHMFQDLIAGNGVSFWSWDIGLGGDNFYYFKSRLLNPFTYIVIIFPDQYLEIGYGIMVILKQYCTGLAFMFFAKEVRLNANQTIIGAVCYAFSGWMIMETLNESGFTNATILFPLLIMGIEKIHSNKSPILFIIVVFWFISVSTTFAYIAGIVAVGYFIVRYPTYNKGQGVPEFFKKLLLFFLYGIIGLLLSSFSLVTYVMSIMGTTMESAAINYDLYSVKQYLALFSCFFKLRPMSTSCTYYYLPCICVAMLPHIIVSFKKSTAKIITFALLILSLFPITGSIFNGFGYSVGRWFFVLLFFWVWASMECLSKDIIKDNKKITISFIWMLFLGVWNIIICYKWLRIIDDNSMLCSMFGVIFTCLILGALYISNHINGRRTIKKIKIKSLLNVAVLIVLIGSIVMTGWMKFYPGIQDNVYEYMAVGEAQETLNSSTQRVGKDVQKQDEGFFRIDNADGYDSTESLSASVNENIYFGNRTIYSYFSILDSDWLKLHKVMGNNSGYSTRTCVFSNDNRPGLDLILGVKYFLGDNEKKDYKTSQYASHGFEPYTSIDGVDILKNRHNIGLGTVYEQYITESELEQFSYLEREQIMMQAAVISDEEIGKLNGIHHAKPNELETDVREIDYNIENIDNIDMKEDSFTVYNEGGTFDIAVDGVEDSYIVISFKNLKREANSYIQMKTLSGEEITKKGVPLKVTDVSYRDTENVTIKAVAEDVSKYAMYRHGGATGIGGIEDFNINMGYYDSFSGKLHIRLSEVGYYTYDDIVVHTIPVDVYNYNASILADNCFETSNISSDYIEGKVDAKNDAILYLSILDNPGWKIYVDGKKTEKIHDTNIAFTGVTISQGKHDIELKYVPTWLLPGIVGTIIGLILFIGIVLIRKNYLIRK